ncbi:MAG: hypothetical protein ACI9R3_003387 [Verrucomicrobiales bacterium]|jgi:hypothetical protein
MRALRSSEIILLVMTFIVIFTVVNVIMWNKHQAREKSATAKIAQLDEQLSSNLAYAPEQAFWLPKSDWLDANMPKMTDFGAEQSALLEYLQETARERGILLRSQTLQKPKDGSPFHKVVSVTIQSNGPDQAVYDWLSEMQSPEKFQYFSYLQLDEHAAAMPKREMDCRFTLSRWFLP